MKEPVASLNVYTRPNKNGLSTDFWQKKQMKSCINLTFVDEIVHIIALSRAVTQKLILDYIGIL